jgi:two-component system, chemotaxis family, CheB/CheR fusion protein
MASSGRDCAHAYPAGAVAAIGPERPRRFFEALDGSYQVRKDRRERVVFAPQNLLRDPPFSRLDLITCRNILIYLEPPAQNKMMAFFHFALREGDTFFSATRKRSDKLRICSTPFRRNGESIQDRTDAARHRELSVAWRLCAVGAIGAACKAGGRRVRPDTRSRAARLAAPASVLIDRKGRILYFHEPTGDYLAQPSGEPTRDLRPGET